MKAIITIPEKITVPIDEKTVSVYLGLTGFVTPEDREDVRSHIQIAYEAIHNQRVGVRFSDE